LIHGSAAHRRKSWFEFHEHLTEVEGPDVCNRSDDRDVRVHGAVCDWHKHLCDSTQCAFSSRVHKNVARPDLTIWPELPRLIPCERRIKSPATDALLIDYETIRVVVVLCGDSAAEKAR
jgi:hypothetical protein